MRASRESRLTRRRLHTERLASVQAELAELQKGEPQHAAFQQQVLAVTMRRDAKIAREVLYYHYKVRSLLNHVRADHDHLHSQFFQEARECRDKTLCELGKQFYDIQKERRQPAESAPSFLSHFPTKRSDQIRNQIKYNTEVSILAGIQRHVGMPAAPEIGGLAPTQTEDDLKIMHVSRL